MGGGVDGEKRAEPTCACGGDGERSACALHAGCGRSAKHVHAYRSRTEIAVYGVGETVNASDVVWGWQLAVNEIFD